MTSCQSPISPPAGRIGSRSLIDPLTLAMPRLPGDLAGLRILQISDIHARHPRRLFDRLLEQVAGCRHDLLVLTGDYMENEGDEPYAHQLMMQLIRAARPRLGRFGVFGNHDSHELRRRLRWLEVHWLENQALALPDLPVTMLGLSCDVHERRNPQGDLIAALRQEPASGQEKATHLRLLLTHIPNWLPAASDSGIDLMLSGHTHGGQLRLPLSMIRVGGLKLPGIWYNATPHWPAHLSSGLYRSRGTLGLITRGIGEAYVDGLRFFCPPHLPLIRLEHAVDAREPGADLRCVRAW